MALRQSVLTLPYEALVAKRRAAKEQLVEESDEPIAHNNQEEGSVGPCPEYRCHAREASIETNDGKFCQGRGCIEEYHAYASVLAQYQLSPSMSVTRTTPTSEK